MSSSASASQLYRSFISLAKRWPHDPLRPELSFAASLRAAAHRAFLVSPPEASTVLPPGAKRPGGARSLKQALEGVDDEAIVSKAGEQAFKSVSAQEAQYAEKALGSLDAILKGRAAQQYPTPHSILKPASHPNYYDRLLDGMKRAAQGKKVTPTFSERLAIFMGKKI